MEPLAFFVFFYFLFRERDRRETPPPAPPNELHSHPWLTVGGEVLTDIWHDHPHAGMWHRHPHWQSHEFVQVPRPIDLR